MTKNKICIVLPLTVLLFASSAHAADPRARAKAMDALDDALVVLERELTDFDRDRDASAILTMGRTASAMENHLRTLAREAGGDKVATKRAKEWPRIVDEFQIALETLILLKDRQRSLDEMSEICEDLEKTLEKEIDTVLHAEAVHGIDTLPAWGRKYGDMTSDRLFDAKELVRNMERANFDLGKFRPRGEWVKVEDALGDAADAMYRHLYSEYRVASQDCEDLAQGERHPKIVKAVDYLRREANDDFKIFKLAIDAWEEEAALVFRLNCEALGEMWNASCRVDHEPGEDLSTARKKSIKVVVDKYSKQIFDRADKSVAEYQRIMGWAVETMEDCDLPGAKNSRACEGFETNVRREAARMEKEYKGLLKMRDRRKRNLRGRQHPKMNFASTYGQRKHEDLAVRHACDVSDVAFPGSDHRPDCVRADGCYLLEFKPDDPNEIASGEKQVQRDLKLVKDHFEERYAKRTTDSSGRMRFSNPAKYGGDDLIFEFIENGCLDEARGTLNLKTEVVTYDRCDKKFRCWE